jgi:hypothetical protein
MRRGGRTQKCCSRRSGRSGGDLGGAAADESTAVWHALHARATQQTPGTASGERGEVVVVALAAALDLAVARERGAAAAQGENRLGFCWPAWDRDNRTESKMKFCFGGKLSPACAFLFR